MALSIRNHRAEQLAKELSKISNESITDATIHALEERLLRLKGRKTVHIMRDDLQKIARTCSALPDVDRGTPDEIIGYDAHGGFPHGD